MKFIGVVEPHTRGDARSVLDFLESYADPALVIAGKYKVSDLTRDLQEIVNQVHDLEEGDDAGF